MGTFDKIGRSKFAAIGAALVVVALLMGAIGTLVSDQLHYSNYWGGRVFAPFALVIVVLVIAAGVTSLRSPRKPPVKLKGRAARKTRQAENTRFPIDDYKKW